VDALWEQFKTTRAYGIMRIVFLTIVLVIVLSVVFSGIIALAS
jgi:hypothetical protein